MSTKDNASVHVSESTTKLSENLAYQEPDTAIQDNLESYAADYSKTYLDNDLANESALELSGSIEFDPHDEWEAVSPSEAFMQEAEPVDDVSITQPRKSPIGRLNWWTLKNKATLLAVALGIVPVLTIGGISTLITSKQLSKEATEQQRQFTNAIALQLQDFGSTRQDTDQNSADTDELSGGSLSERILNDTEINNLSAIVNQRIDKLRQGTDSEDNAPRFDVIDERRNRVLISNEQADINTEIGRMFPEYVKLRERDTAATFTARSTRDNQKYLITYTPVQNTRELDNDLGVLVYQPTSEVFAAQRSLVLTLLGGTTLTAMLVSILAAYLANRATQPIIEASKAVEKLGQGRFNTRLRVRGKDELAVLNSNINVMAEQLEYQLEFIQDTAKRQGLFQVQATLVEQQQQQRESLQREMDRLIRSVASVTSGALTVRPTMADGDLGSLARLFISTFENLRMVVIQARQTTAQINASLSSNHTQLRDMATRSLAQIEHTEHMLAEAEIMSSALETIVTGTQQAQQTAKDTSSLTQRSAQEMEQAANSIAGLNMALTEATDKTKQLSSASQQIHQVISLLNETALKTNLAAINGSIEKRKGQDEGFSVVASEIGQLTDQSIKATREIERIVKGIQSELKEVVSTMELCTAQAADGEIELTTAKNSVDEALRFAREIDGLVSRISESAIAPTVTSHAMIEFAQQTATTSQQTLKVSQQTDKALQMTATAAQELSETVERFRIESE